MYKRKLHSKFLLAPPVRELFFFFFHSFFFPVTFSLFSLCASSFVVCATRCQPTYLPCLPVSPTTLCTEKGNGTPTLREVTFRGLVSCAPPRSGVVTTFLPRLRTKYKNAPETSITRLSRDRQNKIVAIAAVMFLYTVYTVSFLVNKIRWSNKLSGRLICTSLAELRERRAQREFRYSISLQSICIGH